MRSRWCYQLARSESLDLVNLMSVWGCYSVVQLVWQYWIAPINIIYLKSQPWIPALWVNRIIFAADEKELRTNFSLSIGTVFPLLFLKIRPWQPLTFIGKKLAPHLLILRKYPVFVLKPVCCLKPTVRPCDSSSCFLIQIRLPHVCSYTMNSPFVV